MTSFGRGPGEGYVHHSRGRIDRTTIPPEVVAGLAATQCRGWGHWCRSREAGQLRDTCRGTLCEVHTRCNLMWLKVAEQIVMALAVLLL